MNSDTHRQTATIFQFPSRAELNARRFAREAKLIVDNPSAMATDGTDAWYHEAAMREDADTRPH